MTANLLDTRPGLRATLGIERVRKAGRVPPPPRSGHYAERFDNPASVRITDEGDLLPVWSSLWSELSTGGLAYKVRQSDFLDWFKASSGGLHGEVSHYLLAGSDTCVEVISNEAPTCGFLP